MAVTARLYGNFLLQALNKEHDWVSDTHNCQLHTSSYTPDQDTHDYENDLTNEHAASGNYSTGGAAIANKTLTYTSGTNKIKGDGDDVVWVNSTITARTAVVVNKTPAAAASNGLVCYQQNDTDVISSSGTFTVQWHADGIFEISVS